MQTLPVIIVTEKVITSLTAGDLEGEKKAKGQISRSERVKRVRRTL